MRIRSTGLALFAGLSIFVAACSSGTASPSPAASVAAAPSAAPSTAPSVEPSASAAPSVAPKSDLKIGVVTDIGQLDEEPPAPRPIADGKCRGESSGGLFVLIFD